MPTRGAAFAGMSVALVTPFRNGAVDYAELNRLIDWHAEQGTAALVPCGTTGESPTLDHEEHDRVVASVCERAAGRLKVIAGTGSNSTAEAIRLTKHAKESGADAFQVKSVSETRFLDRLGELTPGELDDIANAIAICVGAP